MCAYFRVRAIKRSKISFFKYRMFNTGNEFGRCWKASRTKIGLWDNPRRQPPPLGLGEQKGKDGCYQILGPQMKCCHGVGVMTVKGCSQPVHRPLGSGGPTWLVLGPLRGHCSLVLGLLRRYCNGWLSNLWGRHCSSDLGFLSQFLERLVLRSLRGQRPSNTGLFRGYACFPVALKALNWGLLRAMFQYSEEVLHSWLRLLRRRPCSCCLANQKMQELEASAAPVSPSAERMLTGPGNRMSVPSPFLLLSSLLLVPPFGLQRYLENVVCRLLAWHHRAKYRRVGMS